MSDGTPTSQPDAAKVRADLHEVARLLRAATHLDRTAQQELADVLDELSQTISPHTATPDEILHLAQVATQLAQQLHRPEDKGPLEAAKEQVQRAVARAETAAPLAAQFAGRIMDALANLGI